MKSCLYLAFLLPLAYSNHDGQKEEQFNIFKSINNQMQSTNLLQPVLEIHVNYSDITFYYYSRDNTDKAIVFNAANFDDKIGKNNVIAARDTYFITHGYCNSYLFAKKIVNALLDAADCNIFVIDWSPISCEFYTAVVQSVPKISNIIADIIKKYKNVYNVPYNKMILQGHSLGSHIMGAVGASFNGTIHAIIGLDPSLPLFNTDDFNLRLDTSDAEFVHVIHTNGGLQGYRDPIGHADYYPNGGGMNQPGCEPDLFGSCAHERVIKLYIESLINSNFKSVSCESYDKFNEGLCDGNPISYLGGIIIDKQARGNYYLNTTSKSPFALG